MNRLPIFPDTDLGKKYETSPICMSSLNKSHANLLYLIPILVYVPLKRTLQQRGIGINPGNPQYDQLEINKQNIII